jgi:hypothetical protein
MSLSQRFLCERFLMPLVASVCSTVSGGCVLSLRSIESAVTCSSSGLLVCNVYMTSADKMHDYCVPIL